MIGKMARKECFTKIHIKYLRFYFDMKIMTLVRIFQDFHNQIYLDWQGQKSQKHRSSRGRLFKLAQNQYLTQYF